MHFDGGAGDDTFELSQTSSNSTVTIYDASGTSDTLDLGTLIPTSSAITDLAAGKSYTFGLVTVDGATASIESVDPDVHSPVSDAPYFEETLPQKVLEYGAPITFDVELPAGFSVEIEAGAPAGVTLSGSGGQRTLTAGASLDPGYHRITLLAKDGAGNEQDRVWLFARGTSGDSSPWFNGYDALSGGTLSGDDFTIDEGEAFSVEVGFTNASSFALAPGFPRGAAIDPTTGEFSWTPTEDQDAAEPYEITVLAASGGDRPLQARKTFFVQVQEVASFPVFVAGTVGLPYLKDEVNETTADATIVGEVVGDGSLEFVDVEATFSSGSTVYVPLDTDPDDPSRGRFVIEPRLGLELTADEVNTVTLRLREWKRDQNGQYGYEFPDPVDQSSAIAELEFTPTTTHDPPEFDPADPVRLKHDTGADDTDGETVDPTIVGGIINDGRRDGHKVLVYDGPKSAGILLGSTQTDAEGRFEFTPRGLSPGLMKTLDVVVEERAPLAELGSVEELTGMVPVKLVEGGLPTIGPLGFSNHTGFVDPSGLVRLGPVVEGTLVNPNGEPYPVDGVVVQFVIAPPDDPGATTLEYTAPSDAQFAASTLAAVSNSTGAFSVLLPERDLAQKRVWARAVGWDNYAQKLLSGDEEDYAFVDIDASIDAPAQAPGQPALSLRYSTGGSVSDPTINATVVANGPTSNIIVRFYRGSIDAGVIAASTPVTNEPVNFLGWTPLGADGIAHFTPVGLTPDEGTDIVAVATRVSATGAGQSSGASAPLSVTLADAPSVGLSAPLLLAYETAVGSGVTADPVIEGTVTYAGDKTRLVVEYEIVGGNEPIVGTVKPDANGKFGFTPVGLTPPQGGYDIGQYGHRYQVRVRVRVPDYSAPMPLFDGNDVAWYGSAVVYGQGTTDWDATTVDGWLDSVIAPGGLNASDPWLASSFDRDWSNQVSGFTGAWSLPLGFTYDPLIGAASLDDGGLSLASLTLPEPAGSPVIVGTLGRVAGSGGVEGLTVKVSLGRGTGDFEFDGETTTGEGGAFSYAAQYYWPGEINRVRIEVYATPYGAAAPEKLVEFETYDDDPIEIAPAVDTGLVVAELALRSPVPGSPTLSAIDPTLKGSIAGPAELALRRVEFDYDGDGQADDATLTDALGGFDFFPTHLTAQAGVPSVVRARLVGTAVDAATQVEHTTYGAWNEVEFTLLPTPDVAYLSLLNDTGKREGTGTEPIRILDRITSDPTLHGYVGDGSSEGYYTVEFDHDGDGVADGRTSTDASGYFRYEPEDLANGYHNIRARVVKLLAADGGPTATWTPVTATGNVNDGFGIWVVPPAIVQVTEVSLANPSSSIDPTLRGAVVANPGPDAYPAENTLVEFFYDANGNGVIDPDSAADFKLGETTTDGDGQFTFVPVGLPFDSVKVLARVGQSVRSTDHDRL
ncbi:hypothetical protein Pla175_43170 [Pirellulimonas nuda]|uniref:Uncharacterized protein n=1 Tax=Pirellulimonas nuda TaxID=2528009 RepID=A0A518DHF8_9BACT|nr:hypothetical protein [Pirellulimonas nuda]QDU90904.1 hypothetical protein Pla175_43170 [Pirellulimonas nuda]